MNPSTRAPFTVTPDLALDFLAMFSRFEFSLKVTTFRQPGNGEAKADWIAFANRISPSFDPYRTSETSAAFAYLTGQPLRYLGVRDRALAWVPFIPRGISDAEKVIHLIKQVRNNLFHGGKFMADPEADPERDTRLLTASIVLMSAMLLLIPDVEAAYHS